MIIMGDREEDHLQAISQNVSCIIVGLNIVVSEKVIKLAHEKNIVIIRSPYDTFNIARLINQSIPVSFVMKRDNMVTFNTEDFTDDIQDVMIKNRHRAFPVINPHGKCIGTISRRNFLDMHKRKWFLWIIMRWIRLLIISRRRRSLRSSIIISWVPCRP